MCKTKPVYIKKIQLTRNKKVKIAQTVQREYNARVHCTRMFALTSVCKPRRAPKSIFVPKDECPEGRVPEGIFLPEGKFQTKSEPRLELRFEKIDNFDEVTVPLGLT